MIRTILLGLFFWIEMFFVLILYLIFVVLEVFSKKAAKKFVYIVSRYWSIQALSVGGIKLEVKGKDNLPESNQVAFISNHQSYLDIPILLAAIPKFLGFIAKKELNKVPFINIWMKALKCTLVDRKKPAESIEKIQKRIQLVEKGYPVVLYPEGTRSKNGKLRRFKTAGLRLFYESNVILVPVTIDGSYKILEDDKKLKRGKVTVTIHQPIYNKKEVAENYQKMTEYCKRQIQSGFANAENQQLLVQN